MALDITGITLLILFFIRGYMKGIIVAVFSVFAIVLGLICSLKLSTLLATYLLDNHIITSGWAQPVSYIAIFTAIVIMVRMLAKIIQNSLEVAMLGWVNKTIGGLLYALMMALVWSCFLWIGERVHIVTPAAIAASKTYPYFVKLAPWLFAHIGALLPMAKNIFGNMGAFFDAANQYIPKHVDTAR